MNKQTVRNAGFSLVEVAIVICIGGILLGMFGTSLVNTIVNTKLKNTQTNLKEVDEAIRLYAAVNNRLPCPASLTVAAETAQYGRETDCSNGATPGTFQSGTHNVRTGMVPTRTLNLPDAHGFDGWGSRLIYSVTVPLTQISTYDLKQGRIDVVDANNNSIVTPVRSVTYLINSVGADRLGAYNASGNLISACDNTKLDGENCDNDSTFRNTLLTSSSSGAEHFDDYIHYEGNFESAYVPSGAIMAFDSANCPNGWAPLTTVAGRTIIGAGQYTQNQVPPRSDAGDYKGEVFTAGTPGGSATMMGPESMPSQAQYKSLPPYIAYLFCRKN